MIKFPSIDQFRNAIRNVKYRATWVGKDEDGDNIYDGSRPIPTLKYRGTVKLHGTNAGIVYDFEDQTFEYQSRERILSLTQDNAGFMLYMKAREVALVELVDQFVDGCAPEDFMLEKIVIFGEWCGQSIQKGVAVSELPKMFVIFGVKFIGIDGPSGQETARWADLRDMDVDLGSVKEDRIFNIMNFPSWEIDIDFNRPEYAQQRMVEITEEVERECPVGKAFGVSGVGEGVVWQCIEEGWTSSDYWFKVKGEKHSASKVKTLAPVDIEAVKAAQDFVAYAVTESRLEQGLDNLVREQQKPFEMASVGDFLRWVVNDVIKEETDTIVANQLNPKKLNGEIAKVARNWYINKLNSSASIAA